MARYERDFEKAASLPIVRLEGVDGRFRIVRDRHERLIAYLSGEGSQSGPDGAFARLTGLTDGKEV